MPRSESTVVRLPGPLGGFAEHKDPTQIGPLRCQDCANVIILDGRLVRRFGIEEISPLSTARIADARIDACFGSTGPSVTGVTVELIVCKLTKDTDDYAVGYFYLHDPSNQMVALSCADTLNASIPTFHPVGVRGDDYAEKTFILDGSAQAHKVEMKVGGSLFRCGLDAPTIVDVDSNPLDSGSRTASTYAFKVALCDRSEVNLDDFDWPPPPGLMGNSAIVFDADNSNAEYIVIPSVQEAHIEFTAPAATNQYWTHAILYRRDVTATETTYRYVGYWARTAGLQEVGDALLTDNGGNNYTLAEGGPFKTAAGSSEAVPDTAAGTGPYDFAPTRNNVPEDMRYFAVHEGRSFWAQDDKPLVWYSDAVSYESGGHYEAISGEHLGALDSSITLLASWGNQLLIGTNRRLYTLTGIVNSHTNYSIAVGANLPPGSAEVNEVVGSIPPVPEGTGSHVTADRYFYYIGSTGLVRFDGVFTEDVTKAIQALLPTSDTATTLGTATLAHDPIKHIIYMLVREDLGDEAEETGRIESTIWCYHYREVDPLTGYGQWTRITDIGLTTAFAGKGQRYESITMRHPIGAPPRLVVGMRVEDKDAGPSETAALLDCVLFSETTDTVLRPDTDRDEYAGSANVAWYWQSGDWDLGYMDRRKMFYLMTTFVKIVALGAVRVGFQVDGEDLVNDETSFNYTPSINRLDTPIGRAGEVISVRFSGDDAREAEVMGYAIDAQLVDQH